MFQKYLIWFKKIPKFNFSDFVVKIDKHFFQKISKKIIFYKKREFLLLFWKFFWPENILNSPFLNGKSSFEFSQPFSWKCFIRLFSEFLETNTINSKQKFMYFLLVAKTLSRIQNQFENLLKIFKNQCFFPDLHLDFKTNRGLY